MSEIDFNKERKHLMDLMKKTDKFFKNFGMVDDDAFSDGVIPKKYKELTMVAVSIVSKCKECIDIILRSVLMLIQAQQR